MPTTVALAGRTAVVAGPCGTGSKTVNPNRLNSCSLFIVIYRFFAQFGRFPTWPTETQNLIELLVGRPLHKVEGQSMRIWTRRLRSPRSNLHGFDTFEGYLNPGTLACEGTLRNGRCGSGYRGFPRVFL